MSTNFPTSLDALTNPSSTDSMATVSHSGQHANANDAIEALQAKVGVDSSAVTTSLDYRVAQLELGGGGGGASVTVSDTAPSSPTEGDLWFESDTGDIFVYYDSAWIDVGGSSVANISVSATAPTTGIVNGDLWFDTDTAKTYVYYDDGTSTQWVEVGAASAAASGVDGAVQFASGGTFSSDANNLYWDDTNNRLGINTSSPTAQLDVYGGANVSTTMTVGGNLTVDTSTLHVDSTNNRVGVGTTSPATQADIYTDAASGVPYPLTLSAKNSSGTKKDYVQIGYGIEQGAAGIESGGLRVATLQSGLATNAVTFTGHASAQEWNVYTQGNSRLKIDSAGRVTAPNQPYFYAYGFDWSTVPSGAAVKPPNVNQRNMGAYGYSTSTGRFYAPVDGLYLVGYEAGCYSAGTNAAYWRASLRYNGTPFHDTLSNISYIVTGTHDFIHLSHVLVMTQGSYLEAYLDTTYSGLNSYGHQGYYAILIA